VVLYHAIVPVQEGLVAKRLMSTCFPRELVVGFEAIDDQHRELLERLEAAGIAAATGDAGATRTALALVGDVLVAHFAAEEVFMAESLYPDRARHKAAHDLFLQDFAQLSRELEGGLSDAVLHGIATRVPEWIKFHIRVNDVPLAEYLAARRFRPRPAQTRTVKPQAS
jgi:hemerythrin